MNWVAAARIEALPDNEALIVEVKGKEIGIFQEQGRYYAVLNLCPHARAPICRGRIEGTLVASVQDGYDYKHDRKVLRCPWHHWEFELESGRAVCNIPQKIRTYATKSEDGWVWVEL